MANLIMGIISLSISVVVLANVLISTIKTTNTSGHPVVTGANPVCVGTLVNCTLPNAWSTAELALYGLITVAAVAGLVFGVLNTFGIA